MHNAWIYVLIVSLHKNVYTTVHRYVKLNFFQKTYSVLWSLIKKISTVQNWRAIMQPWAPLAYIEVVFVKVLEFFNKEQ